MFKINKAFKNGRLLKGLIGIERREFGILLGNFSILLKELRRKPKVRRVGGGRKGALTVNVNVKCTTNVNEKCTSQKSLNIGKN